MSLRTGAIEALARGVDEAATDFYNLPEGGVEAALDALLDYLEAHADEWSQAELDLHQKIASDDAWHNSHVDELRHLIAALRGSS